MPSPKRSRKATAGHLDADDDILLLTHLTLIQATVAWIGVSMHIGPSLCAVVTDQNRAGSLR